MTAPRLLAALLITVGAVVTRRGGAEPGAATEDAVTARLVWRRQPGAESCVDGRMLAAAVNTRWARDVFVPDGAADLVLAGDVRREGRGYRAVLRLDRSAGASLGSRELTTTSADCSALDDALALAAGLMLDVSRARIVEERRARTSGAPSLDANTAVVSGPSITVAETPGRPRIGVEAWVGGEHTFGVLAGSAPAGRAGVALTPPGWLRLEVAASLSPPSVEPSRAQGTRGAELSFFSVDAGLCVAEWRTAWLRADGCVTERLGRARAAGYGLDAPVTTGALLFAVGLREAARVRLGGPLWLRLAAALELPLARHRFVFEDAAGQLQIAHEVNPIAASGEVGLALVWP